MTGTENHPSSSTSSSSSSSSSSDASRYSYARSLLGEDEFEKVSTAKILVVGAGGIGCELLKNLVMVGFSNIEIIDLDTIDLSNLNRQFLFQKKHIKKPKSIVARETALTFNPNVNIIAHHSNIKEPQFGVSYFQQFAIVMNALDNLDARRWVNKMCLAANIPLMESGTTGFLGQTAVIKKDETECYDCTEKTTQKTYPVCTIRSTPSAPIHCIVWAKSWLFVQLFGADDETDDEELDKAVAEGEDVQEIANLRKEAREMRDMRASLVQAAKAGDADQLSAMAKRVFEKVYKADIERLLSMEEMWKHRPTKPIPLDFDQASKPSPANGDAAPSEQQAQAEAAEHHKTSLKDQRKLSLSENVEMFTSSLAALAARASTSPDPLSFDKDDDDALDFVTASSNLRAHVYSIEQKTRFETKEMAGNIIPAIASTNAIIAGMLVIQALHVLRGRLQDARCVMTSGGGALKSVRLSEPNPNCGVCRDMYVPLKLDPAKVTLREVIERVVRAEEGLGLSDETEIATYEGTRLLSDPDFDDNLGKTLAELQVVKGTMLAITDEDQVYQPINLVIEESTAAPLELPRKERLPALRKRAPKPEPEAEAPEDSDGDDFIVVAHPPTGAPARKRAAEDEPEPPTKRAKKANVPPPPPPPSGQSADAAIEID